MHEYSNDIAIVGVGCRFPGADNLDEFERVLVNAENHVKEVPKDRWNNDTLCDANRDAPGKFYNRHAGLLNNHDAWDNRFFGVSDAEAARVDPQQRYVLECTHMAMEDAGITKSQINGTKTGVYVGCMNDDYRQMLSSDHNAELTSYSSTGMSTTLVSNRVSFTYNLHGPSLTLDTACSSSLVAIHLGSQAILAGDCDQAICGGVNSIINPDTNKALCKAGMMSETGQCQAFCNSADGYIRAEGCGMVILMKMKEAERTKRKIWGVIKTGCNQDGKMETPITAPSGHQQMKLLEQVYAQHGIDPATIQYIEAHGTGTQRGDPTEVNALGKFFSQYKPSDPITDGKLLIGSVKSNIGHTESAAGAAGLIKVLLMMKIGKVVPSLHVKKDKTNVNGAIELEKHNMDIAVEVHEWNANSTGERVACVNSYGFGGSNSHAIIRQHVSNTPESWCQRTEHGVYAVAVSAPDNSSLKRNLNSLGDDLQTSTINIEDLSYTSFNHREQMPYRTLLFGKDISEIQLQVLHIMKAIDKIKHEVKLNQVFVFSGVGTTWTGMCKEMMELDTFRRKVEEIDLHLKQHTGWMIGEMFLQDTHYDDPFVNHIAIFASQVALASVWFEWGIFPDAIVGQSVGEVAAAHVSGIIPLDEAVRIICIRSRVLAAQTEGSMLVVGNMPVSEIEELCSRYKNVSVAVYSSPVACTLSGDLTELWRMFDDLQYQNKECGKNCLIRKLDVACAYHSKYIERCMADIESQIGEIRRIEDSKYRIISTVSSKEASGLDFVTGRYWAENVRQPVMFYQALERSILPDAQNVFIEIGPRQVLRLHLPNILNGYRGICLPSMNAKKELTCMRDSSNELFQMGCDIRLQSADKCPRRPVSLPKYCFHRTKRLYISDEIRGYISGTAVAEDNSHLYIRQMSSTENFAFQLSFHESTTPFVYEHKLADECLVPGATYVDAGFHVASVCLNKPINEFSLSVEFLKPLSPKPKQKVAVDMYASIKREGALRFKCRDKDVIYASGHVSLRTEQPHMQFDIKAICGRCTMLRNQQSSYACLEQFDFQYGPSLRLMERSWSSNNECIVKISVPAIVANEFIKTKIHPAVVDAVFQTLGILEVSRVSKSNVGSNIVPVKVDGFVINGPLRGNMYSYACAKRISAGKTHYQVFLLSEDGVVIVALDDFVTKSISHDLKKDVLAYRMTYVPVGIPHSTNITDRGVLVWDTTDKGRWFAKLMNNRPLFTHVQSTTDIQTLDTLVYCIPQIDFPSSRRNTQPVLENALERFVRLKDLILEMKRMSFVGVLYILTENTQCDPEHKVTINLCGSEIWGMVRSIRHEDILPDIRLIDVDTADIDEQHLVDTITCTEGLHNAELYVSGSDTYHVKMTTALDSQTYLRELTMDSRQEAHLFSKQADRISAPYFKALGKERNMRYESDSNMSQLHLSSVVRHERSLFFTTDYLGANVGNIQTHSNEGFKAIVVEGKGRQLVNGRFGDEVIFCYPTHVETPSVTIPKECVIPTSTLPFYEDGMLSLLCILYELVGMVQIKSDVILVGSENNTIAATKMLLETRGCKTAVFPVHDLEQYRGKEINRDSIIVLVATHLDADSLQQFLDWVNPNNTIVTLSSSLSSDRLSLIKFEYPGLNVRVVETSAVLQQESLKRAIPDIRRLLAHLGPGHTLFKRGQVLLWEWPMETVSLEGNGFEGMTCQVDRDKLFRTHACYIVVGGLTGLGWLLLQHMAKSGAGHLAIFSRTKPSQSMQSDIKNIEVDFRCRIHHVQVDICSLQSVESGIRDLQTTLCDVPIRGIFNGAGVLSDELLVNQTEETMRNAMAPKILGSWNLHICSEALALDFFVMHSSVVSMIGNAGQSNYAAGNSFIDSLTLYRRAFGLPSQSINWGALSVGMAKDKAITNLLKHQGIGLLSEEDILNCFTDVLLSNECQSCFAKLLWDVMSLNSAVRSQTKKFRDLYSFGKSRKEEQETDMATLFPDEATRVHINPEERVREFVRQTICEAFPVDILSLHDEITFKSLGVDSLSAMNFNNSIRDELKVNIPIVKLLNGTSTIGEIMCYCVENSQIGKVGVRVAHDSMHQVRPIPTPMQTIVLMDYLQQKDDPTLVYMVDIESANISLTFEQWSDVIIGVIARHSHLRCTFKIRSQNDIHVQIDEPFQKKPPIVQIPYNVMRTKVNNTDDQRDTFTFDLETEYPVKFEIGLTEGVVLLRVVVHKVVGDLVSVFIICREIKSTAERLISNKPLETISQKSNVGQVIHRAFSNGHEESEQYWRMKMEQLNEPTSMGDPRVPLESKDHRVVSKPVSTDLWHEINEYLRSTGLTLFQLFVSAYQLLLHQVTGRSCVVITTDVDMRRHIPGLNGEVTRCTNVIPLIAVIDRNMTVKAFMELNRSDITEAVTHSLYPYTKIVENVAPKLREQLSRHYLIMNDRSEVNRLENDDVSGSKTTIRNIWISRKNKETVTFVNYDLDLKSARIELGYNQKVCNAWRDSRLVDKLFVLLEKMIQSDTRSIASLG